MGAFSLLAFRLSSPLFLVPDFSLLASVRTKWSSLEVGEAGRTGLPGLSFPLPRHKCELTFAPLRRLIVVFAARDHHVPRRGELALKTVRARRERLVEVIVPGASEVHRQGAEVDDCLVLAECCQSKETRKVAVGDCWCGDCPRRDSMAVIVLQGDGQLAIKWG